MDASTFMSPMMFVRTASEGERSQTSMCFIAAMKTT